jgi:hypothetical protein
MKHLKYLLLLLVAPCFAQTTQTKIAPPCTLNFTFDATHLTSSNLPNQQTGCDKWTLTVYNAGFGSFSVTLQSALAATPSTPGSFGTYNGTTTAGSNPMTTTGISTFTNGTVATPWMRVVFTGTGTGSVYGVLQGSQSVTGTTASNTAIAHFQMASQAGGGSPVGLAAWSSNAASCIASTITGPNSTAYNVCQIPLTSTGDSVMVQTQTTPIWRAGLHSVDVIAILWQNDGTPALGTWQISFVVGCAPVNNSGGGTFSYVVGAIDSSTPPNQFQYESFLANNLTPTGCVAGSFLQIWVQRQADSGGSTGVTPRVVSLQITMRGS